MPIRVFLSSKMKEFDQERAAITFQIAGLRGFDINAAEEWGALSAPVDRVYTGGVRECHIYIGLFGRTYSEATAQEYHEACTNPFRQKLIYVRSGARGVDPELVSLIAVFDARHKPYRFRDLRDLQPRLLRDLDFAVLEMLNQHLQLGESPPVAQSTGDSVSEEAWRARQAYLTELFGADRDLTSAYFEAVRSGISRRPTGLLGRLAARWSRDR